jgi:uncharacterized protein Usg
MGDFEKQFFNQEQLTTLMVIYYRPDFRSLLQEFIWQVTDRAPQFPRVHRFLDHWRREIRVPIREVQLAVAGSLVPTKFFNAAVYQA